MFHCSLHNFHFLCMQLYSDVAELAGRLAADTTDTCCFNTTDFTIVYRAFQTNSNPIPALEDVFVSENLSVVVVLLSGTVTLLLCVLHPGKEWLKKYLCIHDSLPSIIFNYLVLRTSLPHSKTPQNILHLPVYMQHAPLRVLWLLVCLLPFDCPLCTLDCVVAPLLRQTTALNPAQSMQEKNGDYRVFMMNSYSAIAREVICEVSFAFLHCHY